MRSVELLRSILEHANKELGYESPGKITLSSIAGKEYIDYDKDQIYAVFWFVFPLYVVALNRVTFSDSDAFSVMFNAVLYLLEEGHDNGKVERLLEKIQCADEGFLEVDTFYSMANSFFSSPASFDKSDPVVLSLTTSGEGSQ